MKSHKQKSYELLRDIFETKEQKSKRLKDKKEFWDTFKWKNKNDQNVS